MKKYSEILISAIENVEKINKKKFNEATDLFTKTIMLDGLIYVFGSGHSHIMSEELFYRPGSLFNIYPIFHEPLMVHHGPIISSKFEKIQNYHTNFIKKYKFTSKDIIIIISTSGINSVPIEIAKHAKKYKTKIIAISSSSYYKNVPSRHKSRKYLIDFANMFIDNQIGIGDNVFKDESTKLTFGSLSTLIGCFIVNNILTMTIKKLLKNKVSFPIVRSPNILNGIEENKKYISRFSKDIECLK